MSLNSENLARLGDFEPALPANTRPRPIEVETRAAAGNSIPEIPTPIWRVEREGAPDLLASKPVGVRLRREGNHYFAENDDLALYGLGERVTGEAARLKELYEKIFTEAP